MSRPGEGGKTIVIELEHADVGCRHLHRFGVDGKMAATVPQRIDGLPALAWHPADAYRRRQCLEPAPQRLHEGEIADLARRHGEVALCAPRVARFRPAD